jgi:uncharacterized protein HemX
LNTKAERHEVAIAEGKISRSKYHEVNITKYISRSKYHEVNIAVGKKQLKQMEKILNYITLALILGAGAWYYFDRQSQQASFKKQLDKIEQTRLNLEDSITKLRTYTISRDTMLQDAIQENNKIVNQLNQSLKKVNASTSIIDKKIQDNKSKIDNLWNEN